MHTLKIQVSDNVDDFLIRVQQVNILNDLRNYKN